MMESTTYYWRIDELNAGGTNTGTVWSFTTEVGASPPGQATSPSPANSATDIDVDADLSWTTGAGATSHDVYFGTTATYQGNQGGTTFDTGTMDVNTVYYWRIDEVNANGTTTGTVWSFTTTSGSYETPIWSSTLNNDASITTDGGSIVDGPSSYVTGAVDNAFAGDDSVYAVWDNSDVASIFDSGWDNDDGSTIDLYFRGDHWSSHSGDSGFWSVTDRYDGDDGYLMLTVRDGDLRFPYKDSYNGYSEAPHLTGITLANNVTYRLTVRQYDNDFEVYLDGGAFSNSSPIYTDDTFSQTISFPEYNSGSPGREMRVGSRAVFGGELQVVEWIDHVRVYNGYYTPAELGPK